jgi:serine/alanine adding enzyme
VVTDFRIIETKSQWDDVLDKFEKKDIFFEYDYMDLYRCEGERPILVYMECESGKIAYPFMIRDISFHSEFKCKLEKDKYFDISTSYSYGGYLIEGDEPGSRTKTIELFYQKFAQFCSCRNVISEFIKFSPLLNNYVGMEQVVELLRYKKMVVTNLQDYGDPLYSEVIGRKRAAANKCRQMGMRSEIQIAPKSFDTQCSIYYDCMNRKGASDYYFYSESYFEKMLKSLSKNILLINIIFEDKIIGFGLCFICDKVIYAHVSGVDENYIKYSLSNLIYVDLINWGHENGYRYFFIGGGLTCAEDDSLYLYKKHFTRHSDIDLYLGNKIWNKEIYDYLVSLRDPEITETSTFFPLYRL